nr:unnamed protein product [uncultured bacterium]
MYRLNCAIPDKLGDQLAYFSDTYGYTKVSMVTDALTMYFQQKELVQRLLDSVASDPAKLVQISALLNDGSPVSMGEVFSGSDCSGGSLG